MLWTEFCPLNSHVLKPKSLLPLIVTLFGGCDIKESNWDRIGPLGWILIQFDQCPYKMRLGHTDQGTPGSRMHRGKTTWRGSKNMVIWKARREDSGETNPSGTLILDFQSPELRESKFLLFKPPRLWYFTRAALMKTVHHLDSISYILLCLLCHFHPFITQESIYA